MEIVLLRHESEGIRIDLFKKGVWECLDDSLDDGEKERDVALPEERIDSISDAFVEVLSV